MPNSEGSESEKPLSQFPDSVNIEEKVEDVSIKTPKKERVKREDLPYRPCVGMMIINKEDKILVAKRVDTKVQAWQMPQGGIDLGETPSKAAFREMKEEIGTDKAKILAESSKWYCYDIPHFLIGKLWDGHYRGQKQKWFLIRFLGEDSDININTQSPEFCEWRWVAMDNLVDIIIPFKRKLYEEVVKEFSGFIGRFR